MRHVAVRLLPLLGLSVFIAACGGGGGESSSPAPTYTISGTVSGLAGSGLVLQNNAGNDLTISANGAFTFSSAQSGGAAYAVTVKTQPTNKTQNCVVTNGSGSIASANVTNIAVNCTTVSFAVGGTVSGLAGSGLVLRNNNGDDLTVNANGNFSFATALPSGANYNVTVQAQPTAHPQLVCSVVTGGSGTVGSSAITSAAISCRGLTAKFVYVPNVAANTISGYTVDATTGALTAVQGSPFAGPLGAPAVLTVVPVLSPNGQFLYTLGGIAGVLPTFASTTIINGYQIDSATGQLTQLSGFPITIPAAGGPDLLFHSSGNYAYFRGGMPTSTATGLYGFQVNAMTGALIPLAGSPFAANQSSNAVALTPNGKFLYMVRTNTPYLPFIDVYSVNSTTGALSLLNSVQEGGTNVFGMAMDPNGKFLAVSLVSLTTGVSGNVVHLYLIDATTGQLSAPIGVGTDGIAPFQLIFNATGTALYVSNAGNTLVPPSSTLIPGPGSIASFSIDQSVSSISYAMDVLPGSPHPTNGNSPGLPAIDPTGRYLAATNFASGTVAAFKINSATNVLTPIAGSFVPPVAAAAPNLGAFVFDPSGKYAYIVDRSTNTISAYSINTATDSTTLVGTLPTGANPSYLPVVVGLH